MPKVYIYTYPELDIIKVLTGGAERAYSTMDFSADGSTLATVAASPDFMLTIWDWEKEAMGLHSKAFGQDVLVVRFSMDDPRRLTTCGAGHIRFWKMAATFTGLKLQGHIGKFGKIDLSDIDCFEELPDGKVVSGTETGSLLLWEGNFVKCRFTQVGGALCHSGRVTYVRLDRNEQCLITAAEDGYIRWWDYTAIDAAEVDSDVTMDFELLPVTEFFLGAGIGVKAVIDSGPLGANRYFVVLDTQGKIQRVSFSTPEDKKLCDRIQDYESHRGVLDNMDGDTSRAFTIADADGILFVEANTFNEYHSLPITGVDTCPVDSLAATCSLDGSVRCLNYITKRELAVRRFDQPATCLKWIPKKLDPTGQFICVGFGDGIVRVLGLAEDNEEHLSYIRRMVLKPHNNAVVDLAFNDDCTMLATTGRDGIIFFFAVKSIPLEKMDDATSVWVPQGFVSISPAIHGEEGGPTRASVICERMSWSPSSSTLLAVCSDGVMREIDAKDIDQKKTKPGTEPDAEKEEEEDDDAVKVSSYECYPTVKEVTVKMVNAAPIRTSKSTAQLGRSASTVSVAPEGGEGATAAAAAGTATTVVAAASGEEAATAGGDVSAQSSPTRKGKQKEAEASTEPPVLPVKITQVLHATHKGIGSVLVGGGVMQRSCLLECNTRDENKLAKEMCIGLYSADGKDAVKHPVVTTIRNSMSKKYVLTGASDGSVSMRSSSFTDAFARTVTHSTVGVCDGISHVASSFDDAYVLTAGKDGMLAVLRVRNDIFNLNAPILSKDLEAGVFGAALVKPVPKVIEAEPSYLTYIKGDEVSPEEALFAHQTALQAQMANILSEILMTPKDESADIASNAYSIEDNKLKMGEDSKLSAANEFKAKVRKEMQALQEDFLMIVKENEMLPEVARLSAEEMVVDKEYFALLAEQREEAVEEAHKECAFEAEKAAKLREKVNNRYQGGLLVDEMPLYAFSINSGGRRQCKSVVRSLRTQAASPKVLTVLKEVQQMVREAELKEAQHRSNAIAAKKAQDALVEAKTRMREKQELAQQFGDIDLTAEGDVSQTIAAAKTLSAAESSSEVMDGRGAGVAGGKGHGGSLEGGGSSIEAPPSSSSARRLMRKERKEGMKKHNALRPKEDEDDRRDVSAILLAEKTIGNYKLKASEEYEVPEEQRVNAAKKMRQMAMLEDSIITMRLNFNERFFALRSLKQEMIYSVRRDNARVREIDAELKQPELSESLWEPTFNPEEYLDDDDEVTAAELEAYMKQRREGGSWASVVPPAHCIVTGSKTQVVKSLKTGKFEVILKPKKNLVDDKLSDEKHNERTPARVEPRKFYEIEESLFQTSLAHSTPEEVEHFRAMETTVPSIVNCKQALKARMADTEPSEDQARRNADRKIRLQFERTMILRNIEDQVKIFRAAVDDLRKERYEVICKLKLAELKLLVLFQEYKLLQTFEARDSALQQKQVRCKGEESEIVTLANENKARLDGKMEEVRHWGDKLAQIHTEFKGLIPDNYPYAEPLGKIFRKKVKRNQRGVDGEDMDDDEYEDEDEDEDDDEDEEEEIDDICPPGCDTTLYEKILELREKRLDTEETSAEIQKSIEELKKTVVRLKQRETQIGKESVQTEIEVRQFQLQKQASLNQIAIVVPVTTKQIYMFETSGNLTGPEDMTQAAATAGAPVTPLVGEEDSEISSDAGSGGGSGGNGEGDKLTLTSDIDIFSHVLFSEENLVRLKLRINELHAEIAQAREDLRLLHKERGVLTREKDLRLKDIERWSARCDDLQMLKFGRIIDLDELEANSDRSKEKDAEAILEKESELARQQHAKIVRENAAIEQQLTEVRNIVTCCNF